MQGDIFQPQGVAETIGFWFGETAGLLVAYPMSALAIFVTGALIGIGLSNEVARAKRRRN